MEPFVIQGGTIGSEIKVWRDMVPDLSEEALDRDAKGALEFCIDASINRNSAGMCLVSKRLFRNHYSINEFFLSRYSFRYPVKRAMFSSDILEGVLCFSI